ncbi:DUF2231 domain-containing protein [Desulfovermiculus halophilus]|uniref:DUF2231 domain-containing protein n=1 Tax=Desulfovermiculus halophilus TaxID=339722 RepID=UPI001ABF9A5E|nr:DUF2231 domain-containing protein [Desulfovermiculus halophilus]
MQQEFTLDHVAQGDGREGRPAYVVYENTVYEVSQSSLWKNGTHMRLHAAGQDLTEQLNAAPHSAEVFSRDSVTEVGVLKSGQGGPELPGLLTTLFRFFPSLRRHPHPVSVHFPTAYLIAALLFLVIHSFQGPDPSLNFEVFALVMLVMGVLSAIGTVGTGFFTLWVNYRMHKTSVIQWKIRLGITLLAAGFVAILLRATGLTGFAFFGWIYSFLVFVLALLVMGLGYLGGQIVFPTIKK